MPLKTLPFKYYGSAYTDIQLCLSPGVPSCDFCIFTCFSLDGAAAEPQLLSASFSLHSRYDMYYVYVLYFTWISWQADSVFYFWSGRWLLLLVRCTCSAASPQSSPVPSRPATNCPPATRLGWERNPSMIWNVPESGPSWKPSLAPSLLSPGPAWPRCLLLHRQPLPASHTTLFLTITLLILC